MTRQEHNAQWGANRQPDEPVLCNLIGYGELSQYDARCAACWLGHAHPWSRHDIFLSTAGHPIRSATPSELRHRMLQREHKEEQP